MSIDNIEKMKNQFSEKTESSEKNELWKIIFK
jgi:hypothetical protein